MGGMVNGSPPPDAASDARERVCAVVAARTLERKPLWQRPRWFVPAVGTAALVAAASAVFLVTAAGGTGTAAAARVLRQAARAARSQPPLAQLGADQYLYTKSVDANLATVVDHNTSYGAVVPHVRQVWLRRDGTGWLYQTSGTPVFLSDRDRQAWIAAGRQSFGGGMDVELKDSDGPTPPMASLDLPSDPDALYARLQHDAGGYGDRLYQEMFTMIGDALRENYTTPAQRSALFEVAARLPGIVYVGDVTDSAGRAGVAVAMDEPHNSIRDVLVFGRADYTFLGEEETSLAGNSFGYPAGTVIGHATYLEQSIVDSVPASVVKGATG